MNRLHLSVLAIVFSMIVAACVTTDPTLLEEHSDRLSALEEQLDEISASLDEPKGFDIAVAQYVMDTAGFHSMDETISETSEIDPTFASTVNHVARVVRSAHWPSDLSDSATHFLEVLVEFQTALADDDAEAASPLAGMAHDHQHDLSAEISAWLSGETSADENEHEHDDG